MLTKEELLKPPDNFDSIECIETYWVSKAKKYIQDVFITPQKFTCNCITITASYGHGYAEAKKVADHSYEIILGRSISFAISNMAKELGEKISQKFEWDDELCIESFISDYLFWIVLNHEIAHITHGHIDYLKKQGICSYLEVIESNEKHPSLSGNKSMDFWKALETEADAFAMQASLNSFFYINRSQSWKDWSVDKVLLWHGTMLSALFLMMNSLSEKTIDKKHPHPYIRLHTSQASSEVLAEKMGKSVDQVLDILLGSYVKTCEMLCSDLSNEVIAATSWMGGLDSILKEMGIAKYRLNNKI